VINLRAVPCRHILGYGAGRAWDRKFAKRGDCGRAKPQTFVCANLTGLGGGTICLFLRIGSDLPGLLADLISLLLKLEGVVNLPALR
jgi:hypothetical protein